MSDVLANTYTHFVRQFPIPAFLNPVILMLSVRGKDYLMPTFLAHAWLHLPLEMVLIVLVSSVDIIKSLCQCCGGL